MAIIILNIIRILQHSWKIIIIIRNIFFNIQQYKYLLLFSGIMILVVYSLNAYYLQSLS